MNSGVIPKWMAEELAVKPLSTASPISKITFPNGKTYELKAAVSDEAIEKIADAVVRKLAAVKEPTKVESKPNTAHKKKKKKKKSTPTNNKTV